MWVQLLTIMSAAAIILCAGKGTRMNDESKNKVCFDCAGVPVIRRIISNMREGGVTKFVIVVGHMAETVMECLDGIDGIIYAYQKEQKGTGHAALCGLKALKTIGFKGRVIVSMGDKIVASNIIKGLIENANGFEVVWGVQPVACNPNGGRVVFSDKKLYGVVELADAALLSIANLPRAAWDNKMLSLGLNPKKITHVIQKATELYKISDVTLLCGEKFNAEQIMATPYANAGLYCFNIDSAVEAIEKCHSTNAQGEIYLTDTLEYFASRNEAVIYEINKAEDMLTYSTKPELRKISEHYMRTASQHVRDIESGTVHSMFVELYGDSAYKQEERYINLLKYFTEKYGDKKVVITRAPGRVNLMGRHIDHRGGSINVMTVDSDTVFVAAPREDDVIIIKNIDPVYPDRSFSISNCLSLAKHESWLEYLTAELVINELKKSNGDWVNYVKSAALRFQLENDMQLCGMDIAASGTIPVAAGLSSSSSIVVATAEAIVALNSLNLTDKEFIDLCGQGEWFVGSRGGSGDHAAMKCSKRGRIIHLRFKPFNIGCSAPFSDEFAIIVADSLIQAKKSEGSRDKFNAKVATYEFAFMLLKKAFPEYNMREFRDFAALKPASVIYKMLISLPEKITRKQISELLPEYASSINSIFANHADPGEYDLRGVAFYGVAECVRAEMCIIALKSRDYQLLGKMMKISHDGDRVKQFAVDDETIKKLIETEEDLFLQPGAYGCSTERIDRLCDLLNQTDGVLGSEIVGAGLGGCVIALIERNKANDIVSVINRDYYDKYGCKHSVNVYLPSSGSAVII